MELNQFVREHWEKLPCGAGPNIVQGAEPLSAEWFSRVEQHRYRAEPHIFGVAQFTRWAGKQLLEVGVGAGCDHLQFARAGALCHGVDLTDAAIELTRRHLAVHHLGSHLRRLDAERLPFPDGAFDIVYSWGVIHHTERPERIIEEIHRVLRPGGTFIGMMYSRHSLVSWKLWVRHALFTFKPWRSLSDVVWHHMESLGTKAYTEKELRGFFGAFSSVDIEPIMTLYDRKWLGPLGSVVPSALGWNLSIRAERQD
jgi:SAM-dependent methyltransferase